jgi:large subunit ribosomal protein L15
MKNLVINDLHSINSSKRKHYRVGRGIGSGNGKTSGKGHKGQNARSGGGVKPGFEGGQMPLTRRLPKRGFNNIFAKKYTVINLEKLEKFVPGTEVTPEVLLKSKIISKIMDGVVVLGRGEVPEKLILRGMVRCSASAHEKIVAAGGKIEVD